jgi:4-amino-4-deoxy-L-arabinose transferase-like glycosyltransferase
MVKIAPFTKGLIIVLAALVLLGGSVFVNRVINGDAFNVEEAQHALYSVWLWRDIRAGDWTSFWYDTNRQMVWPFLHSWILSAFFFLFGVSYASARALSFVFFGVSILLIYLLSIKLCGRRGIKVGVVAALLALTSPIMLKFASVNMLEGLGATLFLGAVYLSVVSEERKITLEYVFLALLLGLSIYTNYLYAYLIIPAFLAMTLIKIGPTTLRAIRLRKRGEKAATRFVFWIYRKLIAFGVLLLFSGVWLYFSFSRKLLLLYSSIFKYSGGVELANLWHSLIYYPRVILGELSFSPWIGALLLGALFLPNIGARFKKLGRLYVYVWTVLILLAVTIPAKAAQMMYIVVPFIFIIFSGVLINIVEDFRKKNIKVGALVLFLFLPALLSAPNIYSLVFPQKSHQNLISVLDYFKNSVPQGSQMGTFLNLKRFNPDVIKFHFSDNWDGEILTEENLNDQIMFGRDAYLLTLNLDENSPYNNDMQDDSLYRWNTLLEEKERENQLRLYSYQRFEDIGVTARIFRSNPSVR